MPPKVMRPYVPKRHPLQRLKSPALGFSSILHVCISIQSNTGTENTYSLLWNRSSPDYPVSPHHTNSKHHQHLFR